MPERSRHEEIHASSFRVHGRVQGVGFRYWTKRTADSLRLTGWVKNEADGSVSGFAQGQEADLEAFFATLDRGSPFSRVDEVDLEAFPARQDMGSFEIRH